MDLKQIILDLEDSDEFKQWKNNHSGFFLAHVFVMLDEVNKDVFQVGFYNSKIEKMTTFIIENKKISLIEDQEILKSEGAIEELIIDNIKTSVEDALLASNKIKNDKYKNEMIAKKFFIVQKTDLGDIFNITFFTASFKTINIKISTVDCTVLKESMSDLMTFG